tara:strand:- start:106 stop:354 length:249 start_codon:yes stop_codon:yes gene_type:complete
MSPHVQFLWDTLERFTPALRSKFLQFSGARARLPSSAEEWLMPFKVPFSLFIFIYFFEASHLLQKIDMDFKKLSSLALACTC